MDNNIKKYIGSGICIETDYSAESELGSYHPQKSCNSSNPYGARTFIDPDNNNIIKLRVTGPWPRFLGSKIIELNFKLHENKLIAMPEDPLQIKNKWYIKKWIITLKDGTDCSGKNHLVMHDEIYWVKVDITNLLNLKKELKEKDLLTNTNFVQSFDFSFNEVQTSWTWIFNGN